MFLKHNFFGYFVVDFVNFIESQYKDLYYFKDLYTEIIENPNKIKPIIIKHLAFIDFEEPGIPFITNKIIQYHLDLLSNSIKNYLEIKVEKKH
jgi:hypothetical protein